MSSSHVEELSIVHVLVPLAFGGLESVVRSLAVAQQRRGHRVLVAPIVADPTARSAWLDTVRAAGVAVEPLVVPRRRYVAEWRAVAELLSRRRPSIVHTHGYHGDVIGGLAAWRHDLPVVATTHGFLGGGGKNRFYEWLQCRTLRRFDAVIAVSGPMAGRLTRSGIAASRVHVVPNAFDVADHMPLPRADARARLGLDGGFHVGWIGRLSAEKGPDVMIRALAEVHDGARLSFVGDGPERPSLLALARRLGVDARITWHGTRFDAPQLAGAFDALALSSRDEGTPIVLFEAMAARTPIVATRVGGVPDVVSEAEAVLVPADDPPALARAILDVRANPAAAASRAAAAYDRLCRSYSPDSWVTSVDAVYAAALRRNSARD